MTDLARSFAARFAGIVVTPDDVRFDAAGAIWNANLFRSDHNVAPAR